MRVGGWAPIKKKIEKKKKEQLCPPFVHASYLLFLGAFLSGLSEPGDKIQSHHTGWGGGQLLLNNTSRNGRHGV